MNRRLRIPTGQQDFTAKGRFSKSAAGRGEPHRQQGFRAKPELDVYGLTADRDFAKQMLAVWLREHGVKIVSVPAKPDLQLKIFLSAFGIGYSESLLGLPAFAMHHWFARSRNRILQVGENHGLAKIQTYVFDRRTGKLADHGPATVLGQAKYDNYTILLVINFTSSDIDGQPEKRDSR